MTNTARSYRLLIVDDDAIDRRLYSKLLARKEADISEITQAVNGASGLETLRSRPFDCVLLDFNLPDMNGLEFLAAAAAAPDGELPCAVVLVTGQGNEAVAVQAMKRGAQDYLVKDQVNANTLWRAMTQAVTQVELRQRLSSSLHELTAANSALGQEVATRKAAEAELRAAKEVAEKANQAKTRFVAMVTHELRTPLNGILGYAQLLRLEAGLSARQDAHVGAMMQAGEHLLEMIERVLDFASIEAARMELHPTLLSVRDLTERCIAFISPMATEHGLSLRMVSAHDAPHHIVADPARLRQVLLNLLGNAVKFTDTGSVELRVLAGATPGGLRIEVADTGRGISEASRDRLFQDFERLDAATSVEGTGLGLAIAARIVRLMGGTINHLVNPNGGSVFWFDFPTAAVATPAPSEPVPRAASRSSRRLLLVDDIKMNRDVIGAFLRNAGHVVVLADGGLQAVQIASEQTFDLILMDVRMPEVDGLEATRRIRALPGPGLRIPILALTANTFPDQVLQCQNAGMNGHVAKPVDYETLIKAIDDAIASDAPSATQEDRQVAPPDAAVEPPPPRFDRAVLDRTLAFLPPDSVTANLQSLRARTEQMLQLLDLPADPAQQTDAAHALAAAAGMFGFSALSTTLRNFERAVTQNAPEAAGQAQALRMETIAALAELDAVLLESRMQPA